MQVIWTTEQVLGLAPDANLQKSSRILAVPEKWSDLATAGDYAWGKYVIQTRNEFQVIANLKQLTFSCSCKNRKFPCNHTLALALMMVECRDQIPSDVQPDWVATFDQSLHPESSTEFDIATQKKHQQQLRRGLADLELWLHDLVRTGLANLPSLSNDAWDMRAGRLVDNRAPALAAEIRAWKQLVANDQRWSESILRHMGRIYLLIQAFKNSDKLPVATLNDLYRAAGWLSQPHQDDQLMADSWLVIGSTGQQSGNRFTKRSYLLGQHSKQMVQIRQSRSNNRQQMQAFVTGTVLDATLRIFVSQTPLDGAVVSINGVEQLCHVESFDFDMDYKTILEKNPFVGAWPRVVRQSVIWRENGDWLVADGDEVMSLSAESPHLWHLKALEGSPCFGLWDGVRFHPLSVWVDGRLLDLQLLRGVT